MGSMNERNLVAISIKHSNYYINQGKWKFGMPCVLWGERRTADDEKRTYSGYTIYLDNAELYSLEDWANSSYSGCNWMKIDAPVKMSPDLMKKYRGCDTVLMLIDDYRKYCEMACLPTKGGCW